jgi:hypothetical protein
MSNGRIERTPHDEFLVEMFQDDPRLVEELNKADEFNWQFAAAWLFVLGMLCVIVYGIAIAIDKGQI